MRILVIGGAGYIGSVLVPLLMEEGHDVRVVDTLWFGNHLPPEAPLRQMDAFDLKGDDFGCDQVIFLAGLSNDPMAEFSPAQNFVMNGALPSYLAYIAKQAGVKRFIYASSCSIYGYTENELYDEDSPVRCGYPYGISKFQGERGVMQLMDDSFSVIALRQGTVNGYSPRMRFDLIVNTMYKNAVLHGKLTVNNPSIWRPIIDIRDTSAAFLSAVRAEQSISGAFNVAFDNFTVGQIGEMVKDVVENLTGGKVLIETHNKADFRNYKVSSRRAADILGFSPRHGVTDIVRSLHGHNDEYGDFSNKLFYNIETFKSLFSA